MSRLVVVAALTVLLFLEVGWLTRLLVAPPPASAQPESSVQAPRGPLAPPMSVPRPAVSSGQPPPAGMPPATAPSGRPMGRPGAPPGPANVETLPYTEVLGAIAEMDEAGGDAVKLDAHQKAAMRPILKRLAASLQVASDPHDLLGQAARVLTDQQVAYVLEHRTEQLTMQPGSQGAGTQVLELVKARAVEADRTVAGSVTDNQMMGPEDLLNGIVRLEGSSDLRLSPAQARALLQPLRAMLDKTGVVEQEKRELLRVLGPSQRQWLLGEHERFLGRGGAGAAPPEQLVEVLARRVEGPR